MKDFLILVIFEKFSDFSFVIIWIVVNPVERSGRCDHSVWKTKRIGKVDRVITNFFTQFPSVLIEKIILSWKHFKYQRYYIVRDEILVIKFYQTFLVSASTFIALGPIILALTYSLVFLSNVSKIWRRTRVSIVSFTWESPLNLEIRVRASRTICQSP